MKRFYKAVSVSSSDGGHAIHLDDRPVRTPGRSAFTLDSHRLAEAIAEEWRVQENDIVPESMPLTKLAFTAVDRVAPNRDAVVEQIVAYANSDVVCYRATEPAELVERQNAAWDPILEWASSDLSVSFQVGEGIEFVAQDHDAVAALTEAFSDRSEFYLASLHTLTAISGSLLISLAVTKGHLNPGDAFRIANCDEHYQMEKWGADAEAERRLKYLGDEFSAAAHFLNLLG